MLFYFFSLGASIVCSEIPRWQMSCDYRENQTDQQTVYKFKCNSEGFMMVNCQVYNNIDCEGSRKVTFKTKCGPSEGKSHSTALILSLILGVFGADRFYLGYPAIGLFKLFTFGCFGLLYMVDWILIAAQILGASDGTPYLYKSGRPFALKFSLSDSPIDSIY